MRPKFLLILLPLLLVGCRQSSESIPVIRNETHYGQVLAEAEKLSRPIVERFEVGYPPTDAEKADLRKALRQLQGLAIFQEGAYGLYVAQGKIHRALEENDLALGAYDMALANRPEQPGPGDIAVLTAALRDSVELWILRQDYKEAEACALEAIELEPGNPDNLVSFASAKIEQRDLEAAKNALDKALVMEPKNPGALRLKGLLQANEPSKPAPKSP